MMNTLAESGIVPNRHWTENDGGRALAGYKGQTTDCTCRAMAIVTERPYQEIYDLINEFAQKERPGSKHRHRKRSSAREGVFTNTIHRVMEHLGWKWTATMKIGSGCHTHLCAEELPKGRLMVRVSKHITAVIDGVIHDNYDPSRGGNRCVYGYWSKA
jgi:hypothetical protein